MSSSKRPLGSVADLSLGKMLDKNKNKGEFRPYIGNLNVRWSSFDLENLKDMRFEAREIDRYGLQYGDIVMCEGGEPGRCALWLDQSPGMMIQKALHRIRPHSSIDSRFRFYCLLRKGRSGELDAYFTGSTIKHLPSEQLAKVEVEIPPLETQRRIGLVLGLYDDLMEVNRRKISSLGKCRDLLLPRLISGELTVAAAERDLKTPAIVSAETFRASKQGHRDAIAAADLTDDEAALIAAARIPAEHRYSLDDA